MIKRLPGLHTESLGSGPEFVIIHGWAMHGGVCRDFAEQLSMIGRVTLVDLPGHGASGLIEDFTLDGICRQLVELVPKGAIVIGWSLGGLFAIRLAEMFPGLVYGLVLLAATPRFTSEPLANWPGVEPDLLRRFADNLEEDFAGTLQRFVGLQVYGQKNARLLTRFMEKQLAQLPPPDVSALRGGLDILLKSDLRYFFYSGVASHHDALKSPLIMADSASSSPADVTREIVPALAILGSLDRLVPKSVAESLRPLCPELEVHLLDGAAHLPFVTHGECVFELISGFAERIGHKQAFFNV